jgi:hypothetical protein
LGVPDYLNVYGKTRSGIELGELQKLCFAYTVNRGNSVRAQINRLLNAHPIRAIVASTDKYKEGRPFFNYIASKPLKRSDNVNEMIAATQLPIMVARWRTASAETV